MSDLKKRLVFAESERLARRGTPLEEGFTTGYRAAASFNPQEVEKADEVIVHGNYPEISAAYGLEGAEKKAKKSK